MSKDIKKDKRKQTVGLFSKDDILFVPVFGLLLAASAAFAAGAVEILRKQDIAENGPLPQKISDSISLNASHLSILYQIPQFSLVGLGEILASVTGEGEENKCCIFK